MKEACSFVCIHLSISLSLSLSIFFVIYFSFKSSFKKIYWWGPCVADETLGQQNSLLPIIGKITEWRRAISLGPWISCSPDTGRYRKYIPHLSTLPSTAALATAPAVPAAWHLQLPVHTLYIYIYISTTVVPRRSLLALRLVDCASNAL